MSTTDYSREAAYQEALRLVKIHADITARAERIRLHTIRDEFARSVVASMPPPKRPEQRTAWARDVFLAADALMAARGEP